MPRQLITRSFLNSLGVALYVVGIATLMSNGSRLFGQEDTVLAVAGFLLIFCISAAVVGGLVFGYPLALFLNEKNRKRLRQP